MLDSAIGDCPPAPNMAGNLVVGHRDDLGATRGLILVTPMSEGDVLSHNGATPAAQASATKPSSPSTAPPIHQGLPEQPVDLQFVYDTAPIGLAFLSPDCRYLQINQRLTEICGISVADHLGRSVRDMVPNVADQVEKLVRFIIETGEPVTGIEVNGQRADKVGADRCWLTGWHPLKGPDGQILGVNVAAEEITERKRAQTALTASEQRYRALVRATSSLVWTTTADGQLVDSPEWRAYTGQSVDEVQGLRWLDALHPDDHDRTQGVWQTAVATLSPFETEFRVRRHDGVYVWHQARGIAVLESDGFIREWVGICLDIDDRKRAADQSEAALHASEERWQSVFETSTLGISLLDHNLKYLTANSAFQKMIGYSIEELRSLSPLDILHEEERHAAQARTLELRQGKRSHYDLLTRYRRKDGALLWVNTYVSTVPGNDGEPPIFLATTIDVTDRHRAESELRRMATYLAEAEKISQTGSWARSTASGELFWSPEEWRIFGLDPATTELSYSLFLAMVHPEDRDRIRETGARAFNERRSYEMAFRIVLPDGSVKHIHTVGKPVFNESGDVVEYIGVSMDETERKRASAAVQEAQAELARVSRLTTMGELAASIAHEINQPLAAVVANGNAALRWLARETPDLGEAEVALKSIIKEGNRASEVIGRIRGFLRHRNPEYSALDINDAIREVLSLTAGTMQSRDVTVQTALAETLAPALGDRVQLQQVIMNLVMNGADAMGSVTERSRVLRVASDRDASGSVVVTVTDTGTGIDEGIRARIFDPLFTTKSTGMGMGLSICRSIIVAHGGRLSASPNASHGTAFQFTIPSIAASKAEQ